MKIWSINLLFDEPKISSKTMIPFSYSFRCLISSLNSLILILELVYCSGGDFVIIQTSRFGIRERIFNIRQVLPEKLGPTNNVRLLLLLSTLSIIGFSNTIELVSF